MQLSAIDVWHTSRLNSHQSGGSVLGSSESSPWQKASRPLEPSGSGLPWPRILPHSGCAVGLPSPSHWILIQASADMFPLSMRRIMTEPVRYGKNFTISAGEQCPSGLQRRNKLMRTSWQARITGPYEGVCNVDPNEFELASLFAENRGNAGPKPVRALGGGCA